MTDYFHKCILKIVTFVLCRIQFYTDRVYLVICLALRKLFVGWVSGGTVT